MKYLLVLVLFLGCGDGDDSKTDSVSAEDGGSIESTTTLQICPGSQDVQGDGGDGESNDAPEDTDQAVNCETVIIAQDGSTVINVQNVEVANLDDDALLRRVKLPSLPMGNFCVDAGEVLICREDQGDGAGCLGFDTVSGWLYACPVAR